MPLTPDDDDHAGVQAWRWRISYPGPPLTAALLAGEALRNEVFAVGRRAGVELLPDTFHGGNANGRVRDPAHKHAFWLSEDEDFDGLIDHMLVFAESAIPAGVLALLASARRLHLGQYVWTLEPDWMGRRGPGGLFGPSQIWRAVTPYVTPWRRLTKTGKERPGFTIERQLRRELAARRHPEPSEFQSGVIHPYMDEFVVAYSFATLRANATPPADAVTAFPIVTFPEPVWGPLAFGYGAHFGLGLFSPA